MIFTTNKLEPQKNLSQKLLLKYNISYLDVKRNDEKGLIFSSFIHHGLLTYNNIKKVCGPASLAIDDIFA